MDYNRVSQTHFHNFPLGRKLKIIPLYSGIGRKTKEYIVQVSNICQLLLRPFLLFVKNPRISNANFKLPINYPSDLLFFYSLLYIEKYQVYFKKFQTLKYISSENFKFTAKYSSAFFYSLLQTQEYLVSFICCCLTT